MKTETKEKLENIGIWLIMIFLFIIFVVGVLSMFGVNLIQYFL
jgi:hypothetical protein